MDVFAVELAVSKGDNDEQAIECQQSREPEESEQSCLLELAGNPCSELELRRDNNIVIGGRRDNPGAGTRTGGDTEDDKVGLEKSIEDVR
jgi:hypothetical protein